MIRAFWALRRQRSPIFPHVVLALPQRFVNRVPSLLR